MTSVLWFRRDLRLLDHPALARASAAGPVVPVFVLEPGLWANAGEHRRWWLAANLAALHEATNGSLRVVEGRAHDVVPRLPEAFQARSVYVTADTAPFGRRRDARVREALGDSALEEASSPYVVAPGRIVTGSGTPYKVFTPYSRAWRDAATDPPCPVATPTWVDVELPDGMTTRDPHQLLRETSPPQTRWWEAGESAAHALLKDFVDDALHGYAERRDRPDLPGTSRLSPYLKLGVLHPRTVLAALRTAEQNEDVQRAVTEIAWREFYADVLWHRPDSLRHDLTTALTNLAYDDPADPSVAQLIDAWKQGQTGYPIVDAGMRELAATGWMHNRVRMITASFLTKDLHVRWQVGAAHFLNLLLDGDVASNTHGWQWCAGTGTDASPYFRVFNPVTQGLKFDPHGDYVRRWVPELAHLPGKQVHEPWKLLDGNAHGYPQQIVDHAEERAETLRRYDAARAG